MPLATGQVVFMRDPNPMAALCWLWPLSRDAPVCPRGLQKLARLERGGFCGEWAICHLLLGPRHSFMAQATCKQM